MPRSAAEIIEDLVPYPRYEIYQKVGNAKARKSAIIHGFKA
jgi:hypothetical protein